MAVGTTRSPRRLVLEPEPGQMTPPQSVLLLRAVSLEMWRLASGDVWLQLCGPTRAEVAAATRALRVKSVVIILAVVVAVNAELARLEILTGVVVVVKV